MTVSPEAKILKLVSHLSLYLNFELSCDTYSWADSGFTKKGSHHTQANPCMYVCPCIHTYTVEWLANILLSVWGREWLSWISLEAVGRAFIPGPLDAAMHGGTWVWTSVAGIDWMSVFGAQLAEFRVETRLSCKKSSSKTAWFCYFHVVVAMSGDRLFDW